MKRNMKNIKGKCRFAAAALLLTACLAACMTEFDAASYVKGILNNIYLGDSAIYRKLVEVSEEDAYEEYRQGMEVEADFLVQYYKIDGGVSEEVHQEIVELYQEIYKYSRFEVSDAVRAGEDYQVEVTVSPIDIIVNSEQDILEAVHEFSETADPAEYEDEQVLNDAVARIVVDTIRANLPELGYLEDVTVTVLVEKDAEGYYGVNGDTITLVDNEMIAY